MSAFLLAIVLQPRVWLAYFRSFNLLHMAMYEEEVHLMLEGIIRITEDDGSVFAGCLEGLDLKNGFLKIRGVNCVQFIQLAQIQKIEKLQPVYRGMIRGRDPK